MYHAGCNIVPRPVRDRLDKPHRRIGSHFLGGEVRHGELKSGSESEIRAMTVDCGTHWSHAASLLAETSKTSWYVPETAYALTAVRLPIGVGRDLKACSTAFKI
ncbi:hypothetical protein PGT21_032925 [Puccinia graminis f. sp. tritici]|uniref:Uncharacterized protein n=1 Tax=Puccinia graminis f. sp. tritici TaxID=56615 RepID=A0A5B0PD94_PUCGR|nr:hypothetical protein PGT21_032925 [Puccinia graminis f. sp. tritici]KAA1132258.1 hypothetical protein PGTUg99_003050 [Puccinia graminis f. sp. tritici]